MPAQSLAPRARFNVVLRYISGKGRSISHRHHQQLPLRRLFCPVSTVGCSTAPARCPPFKSLPPARRAAGGAEPPRPPLQTLLELRKVPQASVPHSFSLLPARSRGRILVWRHRDSRGYIIAGVGNQALARGRGRRPASRRSSAAKRYKNVAQGVSRG